MAQFSGGRSQALDLADRFSAAVLQYLVAYKVPLTLLCGLGLAGALLIRRLWLVPVVLIGFTLVYFAALYVYHLTCFGEYYFQTLNSIERFSRVPLRTAHAVGLMLLPVIALSVPRLRVLAAARPVTWGLALACAGLLALQGPIVYRSLQEIGSRSQQTGMTAEAPPVVRAEARALKRLLERRGLTGSNVAVVAQGDQGYRRMLAHYMELGSTRDEPAVHFRVIGGLQWQDGDDLARNLKDVSVVWPIILTPELRQALAERLVPGQDCKESTLERYFLIRTGSDSLACVGK